MNSEVTGDYVIDIMSAMAKYVAAGHGVRVRSYSGARELAITLTLDAPDAYHLLAESCMAERMAEEERNPVRRTHPDL